MNKTKKFLKRRRRKRKTGKKMQKGGFSLLPFWQGLVLETNEFFGINSELTNTIRKNIRHYGPEDERDYIIRRRSLHRGGTLKKKRGKKGGK